MATETRDVVEQVLEDTYPDRIFAVEDGTVWVSGMNANCPSVARRMARELAHGHDVPTSLVFDDEAETFGGVEFNWGENA